MKRHCVVHVHGVDHPSVDLLLNNLASHEAAWVFNGLRFASLTGDAQAPAIRARLEALGFEVAVMTNDPGREMTGFFERSLPALCSRTTDGLVFFAHSKGTSHPPSSPVYSSIVRWTQTMWRHNVTEFERLILPHADASSTLGTLRKRREKVAHVGRPQDYHYSGTFYWMRLDRLVERDWSGVFEAAKAEIAKKPEHVANHLRRYLSEAWPAMMFPLAESHAVLDIEGNTYTDIFWRNLSEPTPLA